MRSRRQPSGSAPIVFFLAGWVLWGQVETWHRVAGQERQTLHRPVIQGAYETQAECLQALAAAQAAGEPPDVETLRQGLARPKYGVSRLEWRLVCLPSGTPPRSDFR